MASFIGVFISQHQIFFLENKGIAEVPSQDRKRRIKNDKIQIKVVEEDAGLKNSCHVGPLTTGAASPKG